jgi:hypothetical protein
MEIPMNTKPSQASKRQGGTPIGDLAGAIGLKHEGATDRAPQRLAQSIRKLFGRAQRATRKRG